MIKRGATRHSRGGRAGAPPLRCRRRRSQAGKRSPHLLLLWPTVCCREAVAAALESRQQQQQDEKPSKPEVRAPARVKRGTSRHTRVHALLS